MNTEFDKSRTMNTEFDKISILNILSFDFASFDRLRTNGINQSFLKYLINVYMSEPTRKIHFYTLPSKHFLTLCPPCPLWFNLF